MCSQLIIIKGNGCQVISGEEDAAWQTELSKFCQDTLIYIWFSWRGIRSGSLAGPETILDKLISLWQALKQF